MTQKVKYKTRQREELLEYLETVPGVHITVNDVCEYFRRSGRPIGTTTVYRQMERLVDEGILGKYIIDGMTPACFEYMPEHAGEGQHATCFHCKCDRCGKLIHLHCGELEEIQHHLLKEHGFRLNPRRTVFYGLCEECAEAERRLQSSEETGEEAE